MKKLSFSAILLCAVLFAVVCPAFADLTTLRIAPVAAYAPNHTGKEYERNAINGGGLNEATGMHSTAKENATWRSDGAPTWFVMDLGRVYIVSGIKIWNYNGSNAVNSSLRQIDILFSTADDAYSADGDFDNGKWVEVVTDTELAKAPNNANYTGCDPIVLSVPQSARFIAFRIDSTWGNTNGGLSEVRVDVVRSVSMDSASVSSTTAATLSGTMATTDTADGEVFLAYGDTNGGTNVLAWSSVVSCGVRSPGESFSKVLDDLTPGKSYVGSFYVYDHSVAANWSAATNFITGVVSVTMPPNFCEAETAAKHIVFSRPASCAAEALEVFYSLSGDAASDYATALPGSIVFAAGETDAVASITPVKDTTSSSDKTLTVTVQPGLYVTDATSSGSVTILDTSSVSAKTAVWEGTENDGLWATAGNWSSAAVPGMLDTVTIADPSAKASPVLVDGEYEVSSLSVAQAQDSTGGLKLSGYGAVSVTGTGWLPVGGYGTGYLELNGHSEFYQTKQSSSGIEIGQFEGSSGEVVVNGGTLSALNYAIGDAGTGSMTINDGTVTVSNTGSDGNGDFAVGKGAGGVGTATINAGTCGTLRTLRIGVAGNGTVMVKGGTLNANKRTDIGSATGSSGTLIVDGGNVTGMGTSAAMWGGSGEAVVKVISGTLTQSSVNIGESASGTGTVYLYENGTITGVNTTTRVGVAGEGQVFMRGGTWGKTGTGAASFIVRDNASGKGIVSGWGTFAFGKKMTLTNNGLFIADGKDDVGVVEERTLDYHLTDSAESSFANSIENDSTNGWYAVNKGLLSIRVLASVAVGDSGTYTWGEAAADDQIDLVNSARVTFTNITTKISAFTGKLYASDRSDVPALPGGKTPVGVWKFDITGDYESAEVEFRYDHVLAKKGVQMYQLDADGETWMKLDTALLDGYRAKVSVTDATRMFAATQRSSGLVVCIR